jgi:hypothetical protein
MLKIHFAFIMDKHREMVNTIIPTIDKMSGICEKKSKSQIKLKITSTWPDTATILTFPKKKERLIKI